MFFAKKKKKSEPRGEHLVEVLKEVSELLEAVKHWDAIMDGVTYTTRPDMLRKMSAVAHASKFLADHPKQYTCHAKLLCRPPPPHADELAFAWRIVKQLRSDWCRTLVLSQVMPSLKQHLQMTSDELGAKCIDLLMENSSAAWTSQLEFDANNLCPWPVTFTTEADADDEPVEAALLRASEIARLDIQPLLSAKD